MVAIHCGESFTSYEPIFSTTIDYQNPDKPFSATCNVTTFPITEKSSFSVQFKQSLFGQNGESVLLASYNVSGMIEVTVIHPTICSNLF